jgi:thioredoxin 1
MRERPVSQSPAGLKDGSEPACRAGLRVGRLASGLAMAVCAWAPLFAGGCQQNSGVIEISNPEEFRREVLESDQPVLVDFYKGGCPLCWPVDPTLDQLAKEYQGRAKIAKFMIMKPWWAFPYWEFKQQYRIYYVPEVLLFNKGVEVKRWQVMYLIDPYRSALDKELAKAPSAPAPSGLPLKPVSPTSGPAPARPVSAGPTGVPAGTAARPIAPTPSRVP